MGDSFPKLCWLSSTVGDVACPGVSDSRFPTRKATWPLCGCSGICKFKSFVCRSSWSTIVVSVLVGGSWHGQLSFLARMAGPSAAVPRSACNGRGSSKEHKVWVSGEFTNETRRRFGEPHATLSGHVHGSSRHASMGERCWPSMAARSVNPDSVHISGS